MMNVAQTILEQLGGRRFVAFTGARDLTAATNSLTFRMPRPGRDHSNVWRITLDPSDTYHIETFSVRGGKSRKCSDFTDIYCDQLVEIFERVSGFYTHF